MSQLCVFWRVAISIFPSIKSQSDLRGTFSLRFSLSLSIRLKLCYTYRFDENWLFSITAATELDGRNTFQTFYTFHRRVCAAHILFAFLINEVDTFTTLCVVLHRLACSWEINPHAQVHQKWHVRSTHFFFVERKLNDFILSCLRCIVYQR